jgi:hypothetical protein
LSQRGHSPAAGEPERPADKSPAGGACISSHPTGRHGGEHESGRRSILRVLNLGPARRPGGGAAPSRTGNRCRHGSWPLWRIQGARRRGDRDRRGRVGCAGCPTFRSEGSERGAGAPVRLSDSAFERNRSARASSWCRGRMSSARGSCEALACDMEVARRSMFVNERGDPHAIWVAPPRRTS